MRKIETLIKHELGIANHHKKSPYDIFGQQRRKGEGDLITCEYKHVRRYGVFLVACLSSLVVLADDSDRDPLDGVNTLIVNTIFDVELVQANKYSVEFIDEIGGSFDYTYTYRKGDELVVFEKVDQEFELECGNKKTRISKTEKGTTSITFNLGSKDRSAKACPRVRIEAPVIPNVVIKGSGGAKVTLDGQPEIFLHIKGSGDINISGRVGELTAAINGSGDINSTELQAERIAILSSGSGNATLRSSGVVQAVSRGSGDILIIGNPSQIQYVEEGSGSITIIPL